MSSSSHFSGNTGVASGDGAKHDSRRSPDHVKLEAGGGNELSHSSGGRISQPEQFRKVFIGGLNYRTTETMLREYFSAYGEIVDCVVMQDQNGRSRGFGFVTYSKSTMVDELMRNRPHLIDRREVDVKRAMPKESGTPEIRLAVKKIFIGAIREGITEEDLKDYFGKYGEITDCVVMRDSNGLLRGFGFVEFDDCDPVDRIVLEKHHSIKGQSLDVKKAVPKKITDGGSRRSGPPPYSGYSNGSPYSSRPYGSDSLGGYYGRAGASSDFFGRGSSSLSSSRHLGSSSGYGALYDRNSGGYESPYHHGRRDIRGEGLTESLGASRPFYHGSRHQMPYEGKDYHSRSRNELYERPDSSFDDYAGNHCSSNENAARYGSYQSQRGSFHQPSRFSRDVAKSPGYGSGGGSYNRSFGNAPWSSGNSERFPDRYSSRRDDDGQFFDHRRANSPPIRDVDRINPSSASSSRLRMSDGRGATTGSDRNYGLGSNGGGNAFLHEYPPAQRSLASASRPSAYSTSGSGATSGSYGSRYGGSGGGGPSRPVNRRYNYGSGGGGNYMDGYDGSKSGLAPVRSNEGTG